MLIKIICRQYSFNPCFSGSLSGTNNDDIILTSKYTVSILVFLDHCLEPYTFVA